MRIPEVEFVLSAPALAQAPARPLPEIAFAGRSNVGKSSLINSLTNRKQIALVSQTPGKTRLLNYFLVGKNLCYFVDLPGYGYSRVGRKQKAEWAESLEEYLGASRRLALVVLILDIRHGVMPLDEQMIDALQIYHRPWLAALTKADKLSSAAGRQAHRSLEGSLISRGARRVLPYSAESHSGREELWEEILAVIS